ncbi:hypothetical protein O1611_g4635 [Lasiodiplodia mahajangana]|uniref:Uncharacterized protein n=1 Tax=Lasiodiplodia mahajangana TaxID=1108764 RepID=A0ACC2JNI9_9PEZI|nr:hypothetical protein O1611_g4635 [Lasiodiplodia mahajangana]
MAQPRCLDLPEEAMRDLPAITEALVSARYIPADDYEICREEKILNRVYPLIENFLSWAYGGVPYQKLSANMVHFNRPCSIAVPPGSMVIIIPNHVATEGAKVAGQGVAKGTYWEFTKDEHIEPDFHATLVLLEKE